MSFSAVRAACTSMERKKAARDVKWGISLKFTFKVAAEKITSALKSLLKCYLKQMVNLDMPY